jgi:hypothetical protein
MTVVASSEKHVTGIMSDDPFKDLAIGEAVHFKLVEPGSSNSVERPQVVKNWGFFKGAVVAFSLKFGSSQEWLGTAVIVAPGVALTAAHNFTQVIEEIEQGSAVPYCFGIRDDTVEIWKVTKVSYADDNDIGVLSIIPASRLPEDRTYYRFGMTTRTPTTSETLSIVGFRIEKLEDNIKLVAATGHLYASSGLVVAVYPYGRDRMLLPYASIELNCGSLGGMSGGAVIDKNGLLVGLISRGLQTHEGDGPTYVSWIINALGRTIELEWPPGFYKSAVTLLSMDNTIAYIDRRDALTQTHDNLLKYQVWHE